ncbi:MAG TPA: hypothetical protein DCM86_09550, partial [Verrucomicrobiales bacterium]|nr:hypothetical protein [Verrucomicrobiales bacterium]
ASFRLLPHPWNMTPVGAIALFGGATLPGRRAAWVIPTVILLLGDLVLGFHRLMPFVYGSFALNVGLGLGMRQGWTAGGVMVRSLVGSLVFFLITNFGNWACFDTYPKTPAGLLACYGAGLPFLRNGVAGDLLYSAVLFGGLWLAERRIPGLRERSASTLPVPTP